MSRKLPSDFVISHKISEFLVNLYSNCFISKMSRKLVIFPEKNHKFFFTNLWLITTFLSFLWKFTQVFKFFLKILHLFIFFFYENDYFNRPYRCLAVAPCRTAACRTPAGWSGSHAAADGPEPHEGCKGRTCQCMYVHAHGSDKLAAHTWNGAATRKGIHIYNHKRQSVYSNWEKEIKSNVVFKCFYE